jgi:hypothetical protein
MAIIFQRQGLAEECFCRIPGGPHLSVHHHQGHNRWYLTTDDLTTGRCAREPLPVSLPSLRDALIEVAKILKMPVALRLRDYSASTAEMLRLYPNVANDIDEVCVYYQHATGTLRSLTENYMLGVWDESGRFELSVPDHLPSTYMVLDRGHQRYGPSFRGPPGVHREAVADVLNALLLRTPGMELKPRWIEYFTSEGDHTKYLDSLRAWGGDPHTYGEFTRQIYQTGPRVEVAQPDGTITEIRL